MANAEIFSYVSFELLDERAIIGQPVAIEHAFDVRQEDTAVARIWPANVDRLAESRRRT
jgi:hypothetical protein